MWPDVDRLPNYKHSFPKWKPTDLRTTVAGLDDDGVDLLEMMLIYPPMSRATAKNALSHRYLRDVPLNLPPITELLNDA